MIGPRNMRRKLVMALLQLLLAAVAASGAAAPPAPAERPLRVLAGPADASVRSGENATLPCRSSSRERVKVFWQRNGLMVAATTKSVADARFSIATEEPGVHDLRMHGYGYGYGYGYGLGYGGAYSTLVKPATNLRRAHQPAIAEDQAAISEV